MSTTSDTMNAAKDTMNAAKDATQSAAHEVKGTMMDTLKSVGEIVAFVRRLGIDDALGVVGLARRPSSFAGAGVFASGVLVGAGIGMLLAPMSGAETRSFLLGRMKSAAAPAVKLTEPIIDTVEQAEKKAVKVAHDAAKAVAHIVNKENGVAHHGATETESHVKADADKIG